MNEEKVESDIAVVDQQYPVLKLDYSAILAEQDNINLMAKAVEEVLEAGIDFGTVPGVSEPFLFDPGASKIRGFFNVYPKHRILSKDEDEDGFLTMFIEAQLIWRKNDQVVSSGVGACSMKESKYRYRWVTDPEPYGVDKEECRRKVDDRGNEKFRIVNPEYDELQNTIFKMAAKRAEIDATQNLPGVSTAVAKIRKRKDSRPTRISPGPKWDHFWGQVTQMGLDKGRVHELLNVNSMNEWLAEGKSLDDAITALREKAIKVEPEGASLNDLEGELSPIQAWDEIHDMVRDLKLNDIQVQKWWKERYNRVVSLKDLKLANPPQDFTAEMILTFWDKLHAMMPQKPQ